MNWKNIFGVLFLLFFTVTFAIAEETGNRSADPVDQVVVTPETDSYSDGEGVTPAGNEPLEQPGLGGETGSDASIEAEGLGDDVPISSDAQDEEDLLAESFDEPVLGGPTGRQLRFPGEVEEAVDTNSDIDNRDEAEVEVGPIDNEG